MKLIRLACAPGVVLITMTVTACAPDAVTAPSPVPEGSLQAVLPTLPEMRFRDVLAGRVTGVRMMSAAERAAGIRVRLGPCVSTIPLERRPLFVVDGMPQSHAAIAGLHPTDILHIHVVKGPIAVRTYGPHARNGAVLIRTRRR